jgi:AmpD protein
MEVNINSGVLLEARQCDSPNCDDRPETPIDLVVVHNISLPPGQFGGPYIDALFTNQLNPSDDEYFVDIVHSRVSSHLLIRRDGEIVQYVPFHRRAWHAGISSFRGREKCNDFSIGIELEGTDNMAYQEVQYEVLATVVMALINAYPGIDAERIVGHSDIAPGRKTDPGVAFNWRHFRRLLGD